MMLGWKNMRIKDKDYVVIRTYVNKMNGTICADFREKEEDENEDKG